MQIVIEMYSLREIHEFMNVLYEKHRNKIKYMKKARNVIELVNGDCIKFISDMKYSDGLRADVAIGAHAEHLVMRSHQEKRIWNFDDLERHIRWIGPTKEYKNSNLVFGIDWGDEEDYSCISVVCGNCKETLSINYTSEKELCNATIFKSCPKCKTVFMGIKTSV